MDIYSNVAPSQVRELKLEKLRPASSQGEVAPSQVRELKLGQNAGYLMGSASHLHRCVN